MDEEVREGGIVTDKPGHGQKCVLIWAEQRVSVIERVEAKVLIKVGKRQLGDDEGSVGI